MAAVILKSFVPTRGVHPPLRQWCIFLCFRFLPVFEKFSDSAENFSNLTFSQKHFSIFIYQNFWWPFLVIDLKFRISPYFRCFSRPTFPPISRKLLFFPYFLKFPPDFVKFTCFYMHALCVFRFPQSLTIMHLYITQCTYWTPLVPTYDITERNTI